MTITAPSQPLTGPGGLDLPFSGVTTTFRKMASSKQDYWIISPAGYSGTQLPPIPLIVFLHGFSALFFNLNTPTGYQSWIEHIVRQGNVVVFPKYQEGFDLSSSKWTPNALASIKDALAKPWPTVKPILTEMMLIGHSAGCLVAANLANSWVVNKLPTPKAMLMTMPYKDSGLSSTLNSIPSSCKLVGVVAENDTNVGRSGLDAIFDRTNHILERSYIIIHSDNHGSPALKADHHIPEQSSGNDVLDWNGLWKFSDALRDYAFNGVNGEYIFDNGPQLVSLGLWSDGVAINPMTMTSYKP